MFSFTGIWPCNVAPLKYFGVYLFGWEGILMIKCQSFDIQSSIHIQLIHTYEYLHLIVFFFVEFKEIRQAYDKKILQLWKKNVCSSNREFLSKAVILIQ